MYGFWIKFTIEQLTCHRTRPVVEAFIVKLISCVRSINVDSTLKSHKDSLHSLRSQRTMGKLSRDRRLRALLEPVYHQYINYLLCNVNTNLNTSYTREVQRWEQTCLYSHLGLKVHMFRKTGLRNFILLPRAVSVVSVNIYHLAIYFII